MGVGNPGPLQEEQACLTAEPSLQPVPTALENILCDKLGERERFPELCGLCKSAEPEEES